MFFVYILECSDGSYYIGHTDNIDQRIDQHKAGKIDGYTSTRLPIKLVWLQSFQSRDEAFVVERKIKGWSRQKKAALIDNNWQLISYLSKSRRNL